MRTVYLDHNATTPLKPHIYEGMIPYLKEYYGNPSSIHGAGRRARQGLMEAKDHVAHALGVEADHLLGGEGVHVAADRVDLGCDALRRAVLGALEHHVLDEVADAARRALRRALVRGRGVRALRRSVPLGLSR